MNKKNKMTFLNSIKTCIVKYFVISGRAGRREFWFFSLLLAIIVSLQSMFSVDYLFYNASVAQFISYVMIYFTFMLLIPYITVSVRRLHDIDKSGFWVLISLIPLIGQIILIFFYIRKPFPQRNAYGNCNPLG